MTINISLPKTMLADTHKMAKERKYASVSELIRDALRRLLYPELTENGFTPEFEEEVLRRANSPDEKFITWDGKTPLHEFMMKHQPKKNGQN